jgi:hypothetical protein
MPGIATPSLNYNSPVLVLNAIIILEINCFFTAYTRNTSLKEIRQLSSILMLAVCAFMIKPIGAITLLFSGVLTLYFLIRNSRQTVSAWLLMYVPAFCAFVIWVTRNLFLSGYPMFPLPIFAMPFDWTMPLLSAQDGDHGIALSSVKGIYNAIVAWARMPGNNYLQSLENGFMFWFKPWLIRNLNSKDFTQLIVFPFCLAALLWFFVARYANVKKAAYFFAWTFCAIAYWFLSAPDIRFGDGFFWVFLGTPLLFLAPDGFPFRIGSLWNHPKLRGTFLYLCAVCALGIIGRTALSSHRNLFVIGTIPSRPVKEYVVNAENPFSVWIPVSGDQTGNAPLPSAPYPREADRIEMREPGNLAKGFRPVSR